MSPAHSGIQALVDLARRGRVEMRPVLLRVLTDLYVQERDHAAAERARFAELAGRLLDAVDAATRAGVAERLAQHPATPPAIAAKLARDEIAVALPVLRHSRALSEAELHSILDTCGAEHAAAIADRQSLPRSVARRLGRSGLPIDSESAHAQATHSMEGDAAVTRTLARRYFIAGSLERQTILTALPVCAAAGDEERLRGTAVNLSTRLERAALRRRLAEFASLLRGHVGVPRDLALRIATDPSGDPLAALCRALNMPFQTTSRMFLFLSPGARGSSERILARAERYNAIQPVGALRLAAAWSSLGGEMRAERTMWTRTRGERIDPRPAAVRTIRGVTPARPALSNG